MTDGIYAFWKPKGPTSHRFLNNIRRILGKGVKVGHAGTLDPLAEGILVVGIGKGTKQLQAEVEKEKEYVAEITLGMTSTTDDEEGEKTEHQVSSIPSDLDISNSAGSFIGEIDQVPPIFSAIKISGKPAYKTARSGGELDLAPRHVLIKDIEIVSYSYPKLVLRVETGKGVYIRSLARDIGERLGVGGYLSGLIRTRVGQYDKDSVLSLEELEKIK